MIDEEHSGPDKGLRILLPAVLITEIAGGAIDLILDAPDSFWSLHVIFEVLLIASSLVAFVLIWRAWFTARTDLSEAKQELQARKEERDAWRANAESALAGFGKAIEGRFTAWGLSPAESEVALLLLKGKSHKEIAFVTSRSERTVRQHAVSVYQKSRLGGRAALAAFFLDDVSLPATGREQ